MVVVQLGYEKSPFNPLGKKIPFAGVPDVVAPPPVTMFNTWDVLRAYACTFVESASTIVVLETAAPPARDAVVVVFRPTSSGLVSSGLAGDCGI